MHADKDMYPALPFCVVSNDVVTWVLRHSEETDGEAVVDIRFDDGTVTMTTNTRRELVFPEAVYRNYEEAANCHIHMIQEIDSRGELGREYEIRPPVMASVLGYGG